MSNSPRTYLAISAVAAIVAQPVTAREVKYAFSHEALAHASADPIDPNFAYGRYCGVGNSQSGARPIDAIDTACMRHDSCVGDQLIPACTCHVTFERRAASVAINARFPALERSVARKLWQAVSSLPCIPDE